MKKLNNTVYHQQSKYIDEQLEIQKIPNLDWNLSISLAAGDLKLARVLFDIMINGLPKEKELIVSAYQQENLLLLRECIHKLHGGCCYTGFSRLKYICKHLEEGILSKDYVKVEGYVNSILAEIDFLLKDPYNLVKHEYMLVAK